MPASGSMCLSGHCLRASRRANRLVCAFTSDRRTDRSNHQQGTTMKRIRTSFNMVSVIALLALTVGCTTTSSTQNKESMLVASGFKVITPKTATQQQKLQQLPPGHVAMVNRQ